MKVGPQMVRALEGQVPRDPSMDSSVGSGGMGQLRKGVCLGVPFGNGVRDHSRLGQSKCEGRQMGVMGDWVAEVWQNNI